MGKVDRVFPGPVNGLIKWMEDNFHDIDQFVATFVLKDGSVITIYDAVSYLEAAGIVAVGSAAINELAAEGEFVPKGR